MIIVDTNIISYLLLPATYTDSVDALYEAEPKWAAPLLWKSEFRNVLALYLRKKLITLEKALLLQESAESLMAQNEFDVPSPQIISLINESSCSSYDCEFVALAHHFNSKLVTQDKKLLREFPSTAMPVSDFLSECSQP